MEEKQYFLLLNERLKKEIIALPNKKKERLREKFAYLENGIWDAGVRVKKLKGPSGKVIFEARINKGDRLIFTLGRSGNQTYIYLWGAIRHDDVDTTARKIIPDNAPFLDFEPLEGETFKELFIDELPDTMYTQESIEEKVSEDYGPQKWLDISDEREWKRLLAKKHPDFFEIFLYMTGEQQQVLDQNPPLLLSGTAGSGKTTIAVYYLLKRAHQDKSILFLTCSGYL
ncbi:MAG: hypothetical protein K8T10_18510, partial [Candidatus Eremiobacteraeota bacterium]|nr:hypothetical protein [Candidatus Eremiobacteraeota bacterium]